MGTYSSRIFNQETETIPAMDILSRLHLFRAPNHKTELESSSKSITLATPPSSQWPGAFGCYRKPMGMWSGEAGQSVEHMTSISDGGYVDYKLETVDDISMERLTLEDKPEADEDRHGISEDTEITDSMSGLGQTAIFSPGPRNGQSHPLSISARFSALSTSSSWVTIPGSTRSTLTLTSPPPPPTQSLTTSSVEVGSAEPSWVTASSLRVTPDVKSCPSISTNHTYNTLAPGGNELHPAFGSGIQAITSTLKKRPRPRYIPKLQPAEDVFRTRDVAHAKRLRQNYTIGAPRLRGYRGCTAACCSCRLRIEDFEQSPTAKRIRLNHMSDVRIGCSRHGFFRL